MEGWKELIESVKYACEYGLHCNDLTHGEVEEEICFALESFAKKNGLPEPDWENNGDTDV